MGSVPGLLVAGDVSEAELVEPVPAVDLGVDRVDGEQNDPWDEPDREEHPRGHPEKAHEKVGIEAVDVLDLRIICANDSQRPQKDVMWEIWGAFPAKESVLRND
jgi:hypothetical protein